MPFMEYTHLRAGAFASETGTNQHLALMHEGRVQAFNSYSLRFSQLEIRRAPGAPTGTSPPCVRHLWAPAPVRAQDGGISAFQWREREGACAHAGRGSRPRLEGGRAPNLLLVPNCIPALRRPPTIDAGVQLPVIGIGPGPTPKRPDTPSLYDILDITAGRKTALRGAIFQNDGGGGLRPRRFARLTWEAGAQRGPFRHLTLCFS